MPMQSPAKAVTDVTYTRARKRKRRFKAGATVDVGTAQRTANRMEATGKIRGVNLSDGVTGAEAQKVLRARRKQKASKRRRLIDGPTPRSAS